MSGWDSLKTLLSSAPGKVGFAFFLALAAVSLYVLATYPLDFGKKMWNNPALWADNPSEKPPAWTTLLGGGGKAKHTVFQASRPSQVVSEGGVARWMYTFSLDYGAKEPPSFTSFSLENVTYYDRPPTIAVTVARPDGKRVTIYRETVPGPRPGEAFPVHRYQDTPLRVHLSGNDSAAFAVSRFLRREFGIERSPSELVGVLDQFLFGAPSEADSSSFQALTGPYLISIEVRMNDRQDTVGGVKYVVGGSTFGLMGTDALGRDLAKGLLFGFPVALAIGLVTAVLATTIGAVMGIISGYLGGKTDIAIQRFSDVLTNIPLLPILIFLAFLVGNRLWIVMLILVAFGWPGLAIMVRSMVLQIRSGQLVEATVSLGAPRWRIMLRHIFPQVAPFVFAQMVFFTPTAILAEAGLSFLGLGDPSIPTWGQILSDGFSSGAVFVGYWWWVLPPGLLIVITALTFVFLALGMEPAINPRLRAMRQ